MKIKLFEEFKANIPNFAIDIRNCSDDDRLKILDIIEQKGKIRFNGANNKEYFISHKDQSGKAWCWTVKIDWVEDIYISGVHSPGWYREDLMGNIIYGKDFIKLGFDESLKNLKFYPEYDAEYKNMLKTATKYNT
jgi:hypothetical protein